jgi:hypothetical protein
MAVSECQTKRGFLLTFKRSRINYPRYSRPHLQQLVSSLHTIRNTVPLFNGDLSWKADSHSFGQEISCLLRKPKILYNVHKNKFNHVHALSSHFARVHFSINHPIIIRYSSNLRFSDWNSVSIFASSSVQNLTSRKLNSPKYLNLHNRRYYRKQRNENTTESCSSITNTFHNIVEKRNPHQSKNRRQHPEPTPASLFCPPYKILYLSRRVKAVCW